MATMSSFALSMVKIKCEGNVMRKAAIILIAIFAILPGVANADQSALNEGAKNKLQEEKRVANTAMDAVNFCYFADKAYSEGTSLNDMVCERHSTFVETGDKPTLYWQKVPSKIIRK